MVDIETVAGLSMKTDSKIVLLVVDGLGGLPSEDTGLTELETASKPNIDKLVGECECGLIDPVALGVTPGSGPSHLALFGYDPTKYEIGRGVLEALGVGFDLGPKDVAARGNFCTVNEEGIVVDRRAGRIPTEKTRELCGLLKDIKVEGAEVMIVPGKIHRFVVVFRGDDLSGDLADSDPQKEGKPPKQVKALSPAAERTARIVNEFIDKARNILKDQHPANMLLLRGFAKHPDIPTMGERFKLRPAAIATYPMYRGVAKLVGMDVLDTGTTFGDEIETLKRHWNDYDFFYVHVKETDSAGEDGNFGRRVEVLEALDRDFPKLLALKPDVLVLTGDHSTPARLKAHSWHPVPVMLWSRWSRRDGLKTFSERECRFGSLGRFPTLGIMPLMLANALKLSKFGA
ncbi:MAG TPA: 2,3-bisphosphoglycerate-independent phosphoglycerate mutase [Firmicutes bacterium]|nr:2,3-bisphosphoglycerate-independent phosphoglycerate mutase [Bacillota bacterium]